VRHTDQVDAVAIAVGVGEVVAQVRPRGAAYFALCPRFDCTRQRARVHNLGVPKGGPAMVLRLGDELLPVPALWGSEQSVASDHVVERDGPVLVLLVSVSVQHRLEVGDCGQIALRFSAVRAVATDVVRDRHRASPSQRPGGGT